MKLSLISFIELSKINHYGADAMVEFELVPESIEQGSYIAMAWEDMLPLESSGIIIHIELISSVKNFH